MQLTIGMLVQEQQKEVKVKGGKKIPAGKATGTER